MQQLLRNNFIYLFTETAVIKRRIRSADHLFLAVLNLLITTGKSSFEPTSLSIDKIPGEGSLLDSNLEDNHFLVAANKNICYRLLF